MTGEETTAIIEKKYDNEVVSISNSVIRSREYTNLLESKIEVLAIYYMDSELKQKTKTDAEGNSYRVNYVELPASDIKTLMGRNDSKSYTEIRNAAIKLEQKLYIIEDKEAKKFAMKHMYGEITYNHGILNIEFNPGMEKYFINLKDNFTKMQLPILFSFKRNGGFQLYKLLKSYAYPPNLPPVNMDRSQEEQDSFSISYNLVDLRMIMGYVDISQGNLRNEAKKDRPNWEKMASEEKHPQYKRWTDFKKRVIDPGIEEINKISDLYIKEIKKSLSGHGGKVTNITFVIQHNCAYYRKNRKNIDPKPVEEDTALVIKTEEEIDDFVDEIRSFISEDIKTKDLKAIADAAGFDINKIKKQYEISKNADIKNFTGWMIAAVKGEYNKPVDSKREWKKFGFERDYDWDDLEKQLLERTRIKNAKRAAQRIGA